METEKKIWHVPNVGYRLIHKFEYKFFLCVFAINSASFWLEDALLWMFLQLVSSSFLFFF